MVRIRLQRFGRRGRPFYRIVAIDQRKRRQGKPLEFLGTYDPFADPIAISIDRERFDAWIARGATPSLPVRMIVLGEKLKTKKSPRQKKDESKPAPARKEKAKDDTAGEKTDHAA